MAKFQRNTRRRIILSTAAVAGAACVMGWPPTARATTYTYTPNNLTTDLWGSGTDWSTTPASASAAELTFVGINTTVLANSLTNINTDNISGQFSLNILDLQGTGPATGGASITIASTSPATGLLFNGASNTINLNALTGASGLTYNVTAAVASTNNSTALNFTGNGTATFKVSGVISNAILNKSGTSTLTLSGTNTYTGATTVNAGMLSIAAPSNSLFGTTGSISTSSVTAVNGGTLNLQANFSNTLTLNGGTVQATEDNVGSGGTISISGTSVRHTFTAGGTLAVPGGITSAASELLVGGGGGGSTAAGGGGGGGGVLNVTGVSLGASSTISVGGGGAIAGVGGNSSVVGTGSTSETANGGAAGLAGAANTSITGGSSGSPTAHNGGQGSGIVSGGGGGGGAGAVGGNATGTSGSSRFGGAGGNGATGTLTGTTYGGGGGGNGFDGTAAAGTGGGGTGPTNNSGGSAGTNGLGGGGGSEHAGGSGLVVIQYAYNPIAAAGTLTLSGGINVTANSTLDAYGSGGSLTVSGAVSGTGGVMIASSTGSGGVVTYTSANTYSGTTSVAANGQLTLSSDNLGLENSAIVTSGTGTGGAITLTGTTTAPTIGGLIGSTALASVITTGYSSVTGFTLNPGSGVTNSYSGAIANSSSALSLTMAGAGTQILGGTNSYTGATTINAGTLQVDGSLNASSAVTVGGSTATMGGAPILSGVGIVIGTVSIATAGGGAAGTISPGDGNVVGTLSTGAVTFGASTTWNVYLGNPGSANATPGASNLLAVTGNIASGSTDAISLAAASTGTPGGGAYRIATYTGTDTSLLTNFTSITTLGSGTSTLHPKLVDGGSGTGSGNGIFLDEYRQAVANLSATSVSLGNFHTVSGASSNVTVSNSAANDTFSEKLDATVGTPSGITASGSGLSLISTAGPNGSITIGSTSAGAISGSVVISFNSDGSGTSGAGTTALATQTITATGAGYNLASALPSQTVSVAYHVGVGNTTTATVSNSAAINATYTETLSSNGFASTTTGFTTSGSFSGITAGGTGGTVSVGAGTGLGAGINNGSTVLALNSNAVNSSGLGITSVTGQTITIDGTGYNLANGTTSQTVNVGLMHAGGTAMAALTLTNTAPTDATYTETLSSNGFSSTSANFTATGSVSGIAGGSSGAGTLMVDLGSGLSAGPQSGTTTLALNSNAVNSSGLGTTAIASDTVTITGTVYSGQSIWATNGSGSWGTLTTAFGTNWGTNQGSPGLDSGFTTTDTATFGSALASGTATVTLDGASPSVNAVTFNNASAGYTLAQGTGGTLHLNGGVGNATVTDTAGNHTITAPVELDSNLSLTVASASELTLAGIISEAGGSKGLTLSGSSGSTGTLVLSGANTYTGTTNINGGVLNVGAAGGTGFGPLGNGGTISFGGGTLQYSSSNNHDYSNRFSTAASQAISVDTNGRNVTFATAMTSTGGTLTKLGAGTLTVSGASTFAGTTMVNGGTLNVTGSLGSTTLTVASGATLAATSGTASIGGSVEIMAGATLAPSAGQSTAINGHLTLTDGLALDSASGLTPAATLLVKLDSPERLGADYDNILINGGSTTANLNASTLVVDDRNYVAVNSHIHIGDEFWILTGVGSANTISGSFNGGATSIVGIDSGATYSITYNAPGDPYATSGTNDVLLKVTAVPEPGSLTLLGLGAAGLLARRRRRAGHTESAASA